MKSTSITHRLLIILLSLSSFIWAVNGYLSYQSIRAEVTQVMDVHLSQMARLMLVVAHHEVEETDVIGYQSHLDEYQYAYVLVFQVWSRNEKLLFRSANAPSAPLSAISSGFENIEHDGEQWRTLVFRQNDIPFKVIVAARLTERQRILDKITYRAITPILVLFLPLLILMWLGVNKGIAPLERVTTHIRQRLPESLEPVPIEHLSKDLLPLVGALNELMHRLRDAYQRHARVASEAAHELRTPLAGTRALVQRAQELAEPAQCRQILEEALEGVDEATHRVDQIMTLARLEPEEMEKHLETVALSELVRHQLAERVPEALSHDVELELDAPKSVSVMGLPGLLELMVGNLVDNAIRHSPPGERVLVSVSVMDSHPVVVIRDTGNGIPEDKREEVFTPFYRLSGTSVAGAGLGLTIVKRIAVLHQANIELRSPEEGNGLVAQVVFPKQ